MIKYAILPWETKMGDNYKKRKESWVKKIFKAMERDELEDKIYGLKEGEQSIIDADPNHRLIFVSTGENKGYFFQRIIYPSGSSLRDQTPEFSFE